MALQRGTRLGPYQIESPLGAGGMGEVYKATDTRLERTVAIKVLPAHVASDPERKARFEREAKVISGLNHPHICTLYEFDNHEGTDFLVMEYLEGETLADRLGKGALPLDQALKYAIEIADALDKAHRQGVTHRDLKPANIMLTKAGAKLLDFGLAKLTRSNVKADLETLASTRTQQEPLTEKGTVLGTVQYMAPEQLEGQKADHRSDIFAFGAIVYEMVTGKRAFQGKSQLSLITAILEHDPPPISAAQELSPPALDHVVKTCLAKDPDNRWQAVGDVARQLSWVAGVGSQSSAVVGASRRRHQSSAVGLGMVLLVLVAGLAGWNLARRSQPMPPQSITRFSFVLPQTQQLTGTDRRGVAISPSGSHLAYVANNQVYLRAMDQMEAAPIPGTEGTSPSELFFSPDGQWVGFFSLRDTQLQKIALTGGATVRLADLSDFPRLGGATWNNDDVILYAEDDIFQIPGSGGTPELLIDLQGAQAHRPQRLPDDHSVLFTVASGGTTGPTAWDTAQIVVQSLETGERRVLIDRGTEGRYLSTGHLVYSLADTILAVPFDLDSLEVTGGPVPVIRGVERVGIGSLETFINGGAHVDVSANGSLVYVTSGSVATPQQSLTWIDLDGRSESIPIEAGLFRHAELSPDETRVALDLIVGDDSDVWIYDFEGTTLSRLTFADSQDNYPIWTPDGERIIFTSTRDGGGIYWKAADGTGATERLALRLGGTDPFVGDISPDGQRMLFYQTAPDTSFDIFSLSLDGEHAVEPVLQTPFDERRPALSPDGHWVAYISNESGALEVYVRPFPDVEDGRLRVSTDGGWNPKWSADGQGVYYRTGDNMMVAEIRTEPSLSIGTRRVLFEGNGRFPSEFSQYDVSREGRRLLVITKNTSETPTPSAQIHVVLNWFTELERLVPTP